MKKHFYLLILSWVFSSIVIDAQDTVSIVGPVCVLAGQVYQYNLNGRLGNNVNICINGGNFSDTSSTCKSDSIKGFVQIIWNNIPNGSISFSSSSGNSTLSISITSPLDPGLINENIIIQTISVDSIPQALSCSDASGGSCSPLYQYQWQRSDNKLTWEDIQGATSKDLSFSAALTQTTFFRRKTTEQGSDTIVYTKEASVYVQIDQGGQ